MAKPTKVEMDKFTQMFGTTIHAVDVVIENMDKGQYILAKAAALTAKKALNEMVSIIAGPMSD